MPVRLSRCLCAALLVVLACLWLPATTQAAAPAPDTVNMQLAAHATASFHVIGFSLRPDPVAGSLSLSPNVPEQSLRNVLFYGLTWGHADAHADQVAAALWFMQTGQWATGNHVIAERIVDTARSGVSPATSAAGTNLLTALADGRVRARVSYTAGNPTGSGTVTVENLTGFDLNLYLPYASGLVADGQLAHLIYAVSSATSGQPTAAAPSPTTAPPQASPTAPATATAVPSPTAGLPTMPPNPPLPTAVATSNSKEPAPTEAAKPKEQPTEVPSAKQSPTDTPLPPTATTAPSNTPVPPTATTAASNTPVPPTATTAPSNTPLPLTATSVPTEAPLPPAPVSQPAEVKVEAASQPGVPAVAPGQQPLPTPAESVFPGAGAPRLPAPQGTADLPDPQETGGPIFTPGSGTPTRTATRTPVAGGLPTIPPSVLTVLVPSPTSGNAATSTSASIQVAPAATQMLAAPIEATSAARQATFIASQSGTPTAASTTGAATLPGAQVTAESGSLPAAEATGNAGSPLLPPTISAPEATATIANLSGSGDDKAPAGGGSSGGSVANPQVSTQSGTVSNTQPATGQAQNDNTLLIILLIVGVLAVGGGIAARMLSGRK